MRLPCSCTIHTVLHTAQDLCSTHCPIRHSPQWYPRAGTRADTLAALGARTTARTLGAPTLDACPG